MDKQKELFKSGTQMQDQVQYKFRMKSRALLLDSINLIMRLKILKGIH